MFLQIPQAGRLVIMSPPLAITPDIVAAYRPRAPELARRIAARICNDVAAFREPRLRDHITESVTVAVALFVDAIAGAPVRGTSVAALYGQLGEMEARAGHDLDAMRAAHHIAIEESWREAQAVGRELELPRSVMTELAGAIFDYQQQLLDCALRGFADPHATPDAHRQLFRALTSGDPTDHQALAAQVGWTIPGVVAVAVTRANMAASALTTSTSTVLVGTRRSSFIVIGSPGDVHPRAAAMAAASGRPVAVSWGVDSGLTHHALRWGMRALKLVGDRVIEVPDDGVIWCADHQSELCLHADPELRRCADEQILAPLLGEHPKRRAALAETMLVWLQTGHAAPAVARALRIHERTVRLRLKHVKELFGDRLTDPSETVGLLSALESVAPRWRRDAA